MTEPRDGLVTTAQAAELLGVPAARIAEWKHRGHVVPAGYLSGSGRGGRPPLYRLEELRPLAKAYLERSATRRARAP